MECVWPTSPSFLIHSFTHLALHEVHLLPCLYPSAQSSTVMSGPLAKMEMVPSSCGLNSCAVPTVVLLLAAHGDATFGIAATYQLGAHCSVCSFCLLQMLPLNLLMQCVLAVAAAADGDAAVPGDGVQGPCPAL